MHYINGAYNNESWIDDIAFGDQAEIPCPPSM
jgi:hypothetical protein